MVSQIKLESLLDKEIIPENITNTQETGDTINLLIHFYYQKVIEKEGIEKYKENLIKNLEKRKKKNMISEYLYEDWIEVVNLIYQGKINILTRQDEKMQELRSSSPFVEIGIPQDLREDISDFVFKKYKNYKNEKRRIHSPSYI